MYIGKKIEYNIRLPSRVPLFFSPSAVATASVVVPIPFLYQNNRERERERERESERDNAPRADVAVLVRRESEPRASV